MDLQLVNKGFHFTRKKKKWVLVLAAIGVTGYGAYRVYNLPSVVRKRKSVLRLLSALVSIAEAVSDSAETVGVVSRDLRQFLQSDSDEIPNSLIQISKIARSNEFSDCVVRITAALTRGIFKGYQVESKENGGEVGSSSGFYDRFMETLFSNAGTGFASVVVGSFARNLVMALYSDENSNGELSSSVRTIGDDLVSADARLPKWVDLMCNERCRKVIGDCIQTFVSTGVAVYLDKTMDVNTYDEFFTGMTNPKHEKQVRDMLVSLCNGSIETLVKTSHQVLTKSDSGAKLSSESSDVSRFLVTRPNPEVMSKPFYKAINDAHNVITVKHNGDAQKAFFELGEAMKSSTENKKSGWISTMSSTLAVPGNKKFVLDVAGRVTFETVRSFLEFLLERVFSCTRRSVHAVNEAIVDRGIQVVRYFTAKASVIATICLSLCLHVLDDTRAFLPA